MGDPTGRNKAILSTADPPELAPLQKGSHRRPPVVAVSRSRRVPQAEAVAEHLGGSLLRIGSVGAKAAAVIEGKADLYVHSGGQWEWDSAAPAAVALACGLWASRLDGSPLRYNLPNPYVEDLLFCRRELAESVLAFLAGVSSTGQNSTGISGAGASSASVSGANASGQSRAEREGSRSPTGEG